MLFRSTDPLYANEMQLAMAASGQNTASNPDVEGQASFTFTQNAGASCTQDFTGDVFSLDGGCPTFRDYDALASLGTGVATHLFKSPRFGITGDAAIVLALAAAFAVATSAASALADDAAPAQKAASPEHRAAGRSREVTPDEFELAAHAAPPAAPASGRVARARRSSTPLTNRKPSLPPKDLAISTASLMTTR